MKIINKFYEFAMSDYAANVRKYIPCLIIISIIQFNISSFWPEGILENFMFLVLFVVNLKFICAVIKSYKEFCK
ncbi:hypothetical protein G9F73_002460 [Clostridium estertheticum]|uniref:hypothetical protein n=1 Tax=Clostridium estertheticum TaxID=238834 RepID=UPI0013EE9310|nr:hypothetical protein [Clostridium estertheticum]MBZ9606700.1 hypothetical protein [Clostridium estertheticum]